MPPTFSALKGMADVLPPDSARFEALVAAFANHVQRAGYGLVITPVLESYGLFTRVGESTDIVKKEMYDFETKGGDHVALRPEGTAPVMRAFLEHHPAAPWKAWYVAPNFRYERPQAGRYRLHHQVGIEAIGTDDPDIDVEVVALQAGFYAALGLTQVTLLLNSLGDAQCRPGYREVLLDFLRPKRDQLCGDHQERFEENPLRVLDCKKPPCRDATADAPNQVDHLCDDCVIHFERVKGGLTALKVDYVLEPRLVRGLDYYTRTTFEFAATSLDAAQNAIGGGGRYDGLAEAMGGGRTPGIGFGSGIERILLACDAEGVFLAEHVAPALDAFVIDTTGGDMALALTTALRRVGFSADRAFDNRSMKAQLKAADRSGARIALIVGTDEREKEAVTLRDMTTKDQELVSLHDLPEELRKRLQR
ncbi:MAG TPA: histidine--tRNA ligase [Acidimicrobiales bacterium]|jgi:histidyl-tRNA synthetase|nr:histidine--tRNA ligase [Acidimicrobiales bacterium]